MRFATFQARSSLQAYSFPSDEPLGSGAYGVVWLAKHWRQTTGVAVLTHQDRHPTRHQACGQALAETRRDGGRGHRDRVIRQPLLFF